MMWLQEVADVFRAVTFYISYADFLLQFILTLFPDVRKPDDLGKKETVEPDNAFDIPEDNRVGITIL